MMELRVGTSGIFMLSSRLESAALPDGGAQPAIPMIVCQAVKMNPFIVKNCGEMAPDGSISQVDTDNS
jgi:hypothetical protein